MCINIPRCNIIITTTITTATAITIAQSGKLSSTIFFSNLSYLPPILIYSLIYEIEMALMHFGLIVFSTLFHYHQDLCDRHGTIYEKLDRMFALGLY